MKRGLQEESLVIFDFQTKGIEKMVDTLKNGIFRNQRGGYTPGKAVLLYDEMGLGKTIQTLSAIHKFNVCDGKNVLVVSPKALIHVWKSEIEKHFRETTNVILFHHNKKFPPLRHDVCNIVLTSYEIISTCWDRYMCRRLDSGNLSNVELQRHIELNPGNPNRGLLRQMRYALENYEGTVLRQELLNLVTKVEFPRGNKKNSVSCDIPFTIPWTFLVIDEAHHFKNAKSKSAHSIGFLQAEYRIALSGTPIMNSGNDLLSILKYGLGFFDLDWDQILKNPSGAYCQEIIETFTFGRKKQDIPELQTILPVRRKDEEHVVLSWDLQERHRMIYRQAKVEANEMFRTMNEGNSMNFFQKLQTLKQICLHPDLPLYYVPEDKRKTPLPTIIEPSPKMMQVKQLLDDNKDSKMICFCSFKQFLIQIMKPWLKTLGIKSLLFYGSTAKEQDRVLNEFHNNPNKRVLLIVKKAGSEGLNLQKAANLCVIMDPHFNKAGDEQAAQRIDRIGQEKEVIVRRLFMKGSIDEALMVMQQNKDAENKAWMETGGGGGGNGKKKTLETQGLFLEKYDLV